jgi:ribosomal protein L24
LKETHQLLVYTDDDDNLLVENINIIKKKTKAVSDASMEVGLQVNVEITEYMFMSHHQTAGQNVNIKVASKDFENVA